MSGLPVLPHGPLPAQTAERLLSRPSDGPIAARLADLWPIAQKRLWQPRYLFQHLTLRMSYDLNFLKPHRFKLLVPPHQITDCDACAEVCCAGPTSRVSLGLLDLARLLDAGLEHAIQKGPHAGVNPSPPKLPAQRQSEESLFFQAFPILKRDKTQTCSLLQDNLTCGAFPAWPMSCERYPFAVNLENRTVFWAKGCTSLQTVYEPETLVRGRQLFHAALETYNQRIRDVVLLHVAMPELHRMGLLDYLTLRGRLATRQKKIQSAR